MNYWHGVMHDDVFIVMNEGWIGAARATKTIEDKDRKLSETPDLVIGARTKEPRSTRWTSSHRPDSRPLLPRRADASRRAQGQGRGRGRAVEEYIEEHAVEDGLLADAMDDDKINKALAAARLRGARQEGAEADEIKALERLIHLYSDAGAEKNAAKEAQAALDTATLKKYGDLTEGDVRAIGARR